MTYILNIDTSEETAFVNIAADGKVLYQFSNSIQKNHASFIHEAIKNLLSDAGIGLTSLSAIAVTSGPGSYTGLRVGLSSAKGLCYALNAPLITISKLHVLALDCIERNPQQNALFCPMIDARRMEVFTCIVDEKLQDVLSAQAMILDKNSFQKYLNNHKIFFLGSGAKKFKALEPSPNAYFEEVSDMDRAMNKLSWHAFENKKFSNLVLSEPDYIKDYEIFNNRLL